MGLLNECILPENTFAQDRLRVDHPDRERTASNRSSVLVPETGYHTELEPVERWAIPVQHSIPDSPTAVSSATLNSVADLPLSESSPKAEELDSTEPVSPSRAAILKIAEAEEGSVASDNEQAAEGPSGPDLASSEEFLSPGPPTDGFQTVLQNDTDNSDVKDAASSAVTSPGLASRTSVVQVSRMIELMLSLQTRLTQLMVSCSSRRRVNDESIA